MALISGSFPPDPCGVGDYTFHLADALRGQGIDVQVIAGRGWGLADVPRWAQRIQHCNPDLVHMQYPTVAYGKSLGPQGLLYLARKFPFIVTVHEFSQAHILRRISQYPFGLLASHMIFSNEYERAAFTSWLPRVKRRSDVINIGSNIPFHTTSDPRDTRQVAYFGLIRPERGLEDFIELAQQSQDAGRPYRFVIIGTADERYANYFEDVRKRTLNLPVRWEMNLAAAAVAQQLSRLTFAYLPYPDGASERRGSLLAALGNGMVVITTEGPQTPRELGEVVRYADRPEVALRHLDDLSAGSARAEQFAKLARVYAQRFSWDQVGRRHLAIYNHVLSRKAEDFTMGQ